MIKAAGECFDVNVSLSAVFLTYDLGFRDELLQVAWQVFWGFRFRNEVAWIPIRAVL